MKRYVWNLLIALDQLINTVFGGDPDETVSSRFGKWARGGKLHSNPNKLLLYAVANWIVEKFETDHFKRSIEEDEGQGRTIE